MLQTLLPLSRAQTLSLRAGSRQTATQTRMVSHATGLCLQQAASPSWRKIRRTAAIKPLLHIQAKAPSGVFYFVRDKSLSFYPNDYLTIFLTEKCYLNMGIVGRIFSFSWSLVRFASFRAVYFFKS